MVTLLILIVFSLSLLLPPSVSFFIRAMGKRVNAKEKKEEEEEEEKEDEGGGKGPRSN